MMDDGAGNAAGGRFARGLIRLTVGALLLVLALLCTLLPFALALVALRQLSAYGVQLITNLEPVYAIVLAALLLG